MIQQNFFKVSFFFICLGIFSCSYALTPSSENTMMKDISAKSKGVEKTISEKGPEFKDKIKTYHVYDDINLLANINFLYDKPRVVIKSVTPILKSSAGDDSNVQAFNDTVSDVVNDEIDKFKQRVAAKADLIKSLGKKKYINRLDVDFDTAAIDSGKRHIISIRFNIQGNIAGVGQPYHYHRSFNYDLDNNNELQISDLFDTSKNYLSAISYLSSQYLLRRLTDKSLVVQGTQPNTDNFKIWNIKPYGLLFTFDEPQVAPSSFGTQTVLIPYPALAGLIPPDSAVAGCLKNHKRCIRNNLLTGGFIDEV